MTSLRIVRLHYDYLSIHVPLYENMTKNRKLITYRIVAKG